MIKILVVEDEQRVAELLKRGLEESGYQVELTYDGVWGCACSVPESFRWSFPM